MPKRRKRRPVIQFTLTGEVVEVFDSIAAAAKKLNIPTASISNCVHGKVKTHKGFIWKFLDE